MNFCVVRRTEEKPHEIFIFRGWEMPFPTSSGQFHNSKHGEKVAYSVPYVVYMSTFGIIDSGINSRD